MILLTKHTTHYLLSPFSEFGTLVMALCPAVFRSWELELGTRSAPLQLRSSRAFNFLKNRYCRIHVRWFPYSAWFPLFSQWIRRWASVIFLTIFLLATLFPVARALSTSAQEVGICFHSVQSLFDLSRIKCFSKCLFSLQFRHTRLIVSYLIFFSENKSEW